MRRKVKYEVKHCLRHLYQALNDRLTYITQTAATTTNAPGSQNGGPPRSYDVFLGGTCNNLKWREKTVIPVLREVGVSFFNPVVKEWSDDCVVAEHHAKNNSRLLLFYLDPCQLSPASLIEITYLGCSKPNRLIAVIPDCIRNKCDDVHDPIIDASRALVKTILSRFSCQVYTSLEGTVANFRSKWKRWWMLNVIAMSSDDGLLDECGSAEQLFDMNGPDDFDVDELSACSLEDFDEILEDEFDVNAAQPLKLLVNKPCLVNRLQEEFSSAEIFVPDDITKEIEDPCCDLAIYEITHGEEENVLFYVQAAALVARMVPLVLLVRKGDFVVSAFEKRCEAYMADIANQAPGLLGMFTLTEKDNIFSKVHEFYKLQISQDYIMKE